MKRLIILIALSASYLYASELTTRPAELWRFKADGAIAGAPITLNSQIIFTTESGTVFALMNNGKLAWKTSPGTNTSFSTPPLQANKKIIASSDEGVIYALDTKTGDFQWSYDTNEETRSGIAVTDDGIMVIAVTQASGIVHAIHSETGKRDWKPRETSRCDGRPSAGNGRVVFGNCDAALHVFKSSSGRRLKSIDLGPNGQVASGIALLGDLAYTGTYGGDVFCADIKKGKVVWKYSNNRISVMTKPAISMSRVALANERGDVFFLNTKGELLWKSKVSGSPSDPLITGNKLLISSDGSIFMLELDDGEVLWSHNISDEITAPVIAGNMIVTGTETGYITAYGEKNEQ